MGSAPGARWQTRVRPSPGSSKRCPQCWPGMFAIRNRFCASALELNLAPWLQDTWKRPCDFGWCCLPVPLDALDTIMLATRAG